MINHCIIKYINCNFDKSINLIINHFSINQLFQLICILCIIIIDYKKKNNYRIALVRAPAVCAHAYNSDWLKLCVRYINMSLCIISVYVLLH